MADSRWDSVVRKNLPALVDVLNVPALRVRLFAEKLLTRPEMQEIRGMTDVVAAEHLLVDVLPRKGPKAYDVFVDVVLKTEGQAHIADRFLTQYDEDAYGHYSIIEAGTDKEQVDAVQMQTIYTAEVLALKLTTLALHNERILCGRHSSRQATYPLHFTWKTWDTQLPSDKFLRGQVATTDVHLVVGGFHGQIHALNVSGGDRQWKTVTRHGADICALTCSPAFQLAVVYDKQTCHSLIESFNVDSGLWHPIASLPSELQLHDVAVVVHGQFLYAVGGRTGCGKCVPTARFLNLNTRVWFGLPDMLVARYCCSVVVVGDTLCVGGGRDKEGRFSNRVETLRLATDFERWQEVTPSTRYDPTLLQFNGLLLALGGRDGETYTDVATSSAELLDVSTSHEWLALPDMNLTWMSHGAATLGDRMVVAGGMSAARYAIESAELYTATSTMF